MRELKFRVWWKDESEPSIYTEYDLFDDTWTNAEHTAIEQYTGLKDKSDKEICEGDIVRWSFKGMNNRLIHTADAVEWKSYAEEEWPYSTISGFTLPDSEDGYEVIGNIHENPELLEVK